MKNMQFVKDNEYGCETVKTGPFAKFARTQKLADPIKVPIRMDELTGADCPDQCHTNALSLAYRYGGGVLTGLVERATLYNFEVAFGHSVWITPEGNAVCPAAKDWGSGKDFELIPCWEYTHSEVCAFFANKMVLEHPEGVMFKKNEKNGEYLLVSNHFAFAIGFENLFSNLPDKARKLAIKELTREGFAGSKSIPLGRSLIENERFKVCTDLEWFYETQHQEYFKKLKYTRDEIVSRS